MILPPVGAAWRFDLYWVPKRSGAPAVAPDPLASGEPLPEAFELAGGWLAVLLEADGLAAPWHAANTNIALAKTPARRFCMNGPPNSCVSPHCRLQDDVVSPGSPFADFRPPRKGGRSKVETGMRGHRVSVRVLRSGYYGHAT